MGPESERQKESPEVREAGLDRLSNNIANQEAAENRADPAFKIYLDELLHQGVIDECIFALSTSHPLAKCALKEYLKEFSGNIFHSEEFGDPQDKALSRFFELVIEQMRFFISVPEDRRDAIFGTDRGELKVDIVKIIEKLDQGGVTTIDAVESLVNPHIYKKLIYNPEADEFKKLLGE